MTYSARTESLQFGDTVLTHVPSWAHKTDGTCPIRMAVVIDDLGPVLMVALTSTSEIRSEQPEAYYRPRIEGDGCGIGNSLAHLSEVVLEPDGRVIVDKQDLIHTRQGGLKRGQLSSADKFLIAALTHQVNPDLPRARTTADQMADLIHSN